MNKINIYQHIYKLKEIKDIVHNLYSPAFGTKRGVLVVTTVL